MHPLKIVEAFDPIGDVEPGLRPRLVARERTGGQYIAVLSEATQVGTLPRLFARCRYLAGLETATETAAAIRNAHQGLKADHSPVRVAWAPDRVNYLGAVMAPPGPITQSQHLLLLEGRVQEMADDGDPEELQELETELLNRGMQPDLSNPRRAGSEIVAALEGNLSAIGALAGMTTIVPDETDEEAQDKLDDQTLMDWVSQVLSS